MASFDAVVVGAGPNGLTAAAVLARAGLAVRVYEASDKVGGGARTDELTLPGFRHDPCSAVHPLGVGSPVWKTMPLERHGLEWVHPELPLAHPHPDGSVAVLARSVDETARGFGADEDAYRRMLRPFLGHWDALADDLLRPLLARPPAHPVLSTRFGLRALQSTRMLARRFREGRVRALLAGLGAHAISPLRSLATGGVTEMFALTAHEVGWPFPRRGSQAVSDALASYLRSLGGEIVTGRRVRALGELPSARAYLLDVSARELVSIAGERLSRRYVRRLRRFRSGPAVFKLDYALDAPVPWKADECHRAGTVHVGSSFEEIDAALDAVARGRPPAPPFLVTAQPSLFDETRAPAGKHVFWVYAHVPNGWQGDLTSAVEDQLERFAPGFRDVVVARAMAGPAELEARNPNEVGGDIACGRFGGIQAVFRPVIARVPYRTSDRTVYLCSSATPPGPGVHGMCGYHAANDALARVFDAGGNERRSAEAT